MQLLTSAVPNLEFIHDELHGELNDAESFIQSAAVHGVLHIRWNLLPGDDATKRATLAPTARKVRQTIIDLGLWTREARVNSGFSMDMGSMGNYFRYIHPDFVEQVEKVREGDKAAASACLVLVAQ